MAGHAILEDQGAGAIRAVATRRKARLEITGSRSALQDQRCKTALRDQTMEPFDPDLPGPPRAGDPEAPEDDREAGLAVAPRRRVRRPRRFQVMMHNDDYTSMEFVVKVLIEHFHKPPAEATHVMLQIHHKGVGVAGVYSRDVAETKVAEVTAEARANGMPLLLTAEPEDAGREDA
jgi:ATP-dependent Clp protease adaptor protein ClpS